MSMKKELPKCWLAMFDDTSCKKAFHEQIKSPTSATLRKTKTTSP